MGWKVTYINWLFLQSIVSEPDCISRGARFTSQQDAWIELEEAGVVRPLAAVPGIGVSSATIRMQVARDIVGQLAYAPSPSELGFYSWIACGAMGADGRSACDRDRVSAADPEQRIVDAQMLPDQAYAVALGVGDPRLTRNRLASMVRRGMASSTLVRNNLVPFESIDPRIVSSADKWDPVTADGFCDPAAGGRPARGPLLGLAIG